MSDPIQSRSDRIRLVIVRVPTVVGWITIAISAVVLIGWMAGVEAAASLLLSGTPVKPNGALALILCGAALILLNGDDPPSRNRSAGFMCAMGAFAIGLITLAEHFLNSGRGFDSIFIHDRMLLARGILDIRMGKLASFTISLLTGGLAVLARRDKRGSSLADGAFVISAGLALIGLLSNAYGALPIGGLGHALNIPIPAVALTFACSIAAMLLRPDSRLVRPFVSGGAGGQLVAAMLPFVVIVPFALGALHITQMISPENASLQAALSSAITAIVFAIVIWKSAEKLNQLDAQKEMVNRERSELALHAERELARTDTEIEIRVATQAAYDALRKVTDRQRETEIFFSAALNSAPLAFLFWNENLRIIRVNSLVGKWGEKDPRTYIGKTVEQVAPDAAPQISPILREVLETGTPHPDVEIIRPAGGDPRGRTINGMFYPVTTSEHKVVGVMAILEDVTHERAREAALLETSERYSYVAKATNDAVWDLDVASNKLVWNESVSSLFGYRLEDIIPELSWWEDRIHPEDHERVVHSFHEAVKGGQDIWATGYRFRNSDGSYSTVVDRGYIIRGQDGRARRAIGAMSDRTLQSALEESLRHSQKMDAVGRLSAGVAHDFNNVLAVINISADFLLSVLRPDSDEFQEASEVKKAADRAGRLTKQLLAFTRQQILSAVPLDLNAALDEMLGMLHRLVSDKVELVVVRDPDLRLIKADGGQMEQVALNLVLNARDSMPDGGTVRIETANFSGSIPCAPGVQGDFVSVSVTDTGTGMSTDTLNRIFEPFFTTKEIGQGTGLGLATVLGIVKQSGGEICVDSRLGAGSTFTVYFPVFAGADTQKRSPTEETGRVVETAAHTILLVEDDPALRKSVERILVRAGYRVLSATNGAEALEVGEAHQGRIALVLTDARMPVMGGAELVRHIRDRRIDTSVLVMSGYTEEIETGMVEGGSIPFIGKPFTSASLLEKVRSVIGGH